MNILVVEDNQVDLKLAVAVLKDSGYSVREHITAEEAIKAVSKDKPDLILLDLRLPGMDGMSFVKKLKGGAETRRIPIVVVTAFPNLFNKAELLAAGCDAYLSKPIDTRTLSQKLAEAAGRSSRGE